MNMGNKCLADKLIVDTSNYSIMPPVGKEKKYLGKHVAIASFKNPVILAHGNDPAKVRRRLDYQGISESIIIYLPPDEAYAYRAA